MSYSRSVSGGSWVARAPQRRGRNGPVIGRYDTRAQAERALTAWLAEQFTAGRKGGEQ